MVTTLARGDSSSGIAGLVLGSLVVWTLIPFGEAQRHFPALDLGLLIALAGLCGLAVTLVVSAAAHGPRRLALPRVEALILWGVCGLALLCAAAAVAVSAMSFNLEYIVLAQRHTTLFVLTQPAAASIYVVALALAGQRAPITASLGPVSRARLAAEVAVVSSLGALGGTLFLGGFLGAGLPGPTWVLLKALAVGALLLLTRRRLAGLAAGAQLALACAACLLGVLNLALTFVVLRMP